MAFIQIIEFTTSRFEEGATFIEEYQQATEGRRTVRRVLACQDRNKPDHYFTIAFFDSYESAMENSNLPETQALAEKLAGLADGPSTFYDLEVVHES